MGLWHLWEYHGAIKDKFKAEDYTRNPIRK